MKYLGVDLHNNSFTVCTIEEQEVIGYQTYAICEIEKFKKQLKGKEIVAVEATGNSRYFVRQIEKLVEKVVLVNPSKFEVIRKSTSKTDHNDARALATFLSKDLLPQARLKSEKEEQLSSICQTRDKLVKLRTTLINKIHAIFIGAGIKEKKEAFSSELKLHQVLDMKWDYLVRVELEVMVGQIFSLNQSIEKLEKEIAQEGKKLAGYENLISIKGIGVKSAVILLTVIGNIGDFESEDKLASYFGIVPRVSNSNETVHHGRITKQGSKLGRTTLVQCTLVAIKYSSYLRAFYDRIKSRRGSGKAIIATSKKFLSIIYRCLKFNWIFSDFPNFVLAS